MVTTVEHLLLDFFIILLSNYRFKEMALQQEKKSILNYHDIIYSFKILFDFLKTANIYVLPI